MLTDESEMSTAIRASRCSQPGSESMSSNIALDIGYFEQHLRRKGRRGFERTWGKGREGEEREKGKGRA
jgi:hypothetical protein